MQLYQTYNNEQPYEKRQPPFRPTGPHMAFAQFSYESFSHQILDHIPIETTNEVEQP